MNVLLYLLVPMMLVGLAATVVWARNRQPTSLESGVDAFRREMNALSPDAAPGRRRSPGEDPEPALVDEAAVRPRVTPPRRGPGRRPGAGGPR